MKHFSSFILIFVLLTSCSQNSSSSDVSHELNELIQARIAQIENSFRYRLLSEIGRIPSIQEIELFFLQLSELDDPSSVNDLLNDFSKKHNIRLQKLKSKANQKSILLLNKLAVFDDLLYTALNTENSFSQLMPVVELHEETPNEAMYNIVLHGYDSLFLPAIQIIAKNDTFDILVDELSGIGKITINKKYPNDKHQFKGDVVLWKTSKTQERIPFRYPNKH